MRARTLLTPAALAAGTFLFLCSDPAAAEDIDGTPGNDVLVGNDGEADHIHGGDGDDTVSGGSGDDEHVAGDDGDDVVDGGAGNEVQDGEGNLGVDGGSGDDTVTGGEGDDHVDGGPGDDAVDGGPGDDVVLGDGDSTCFSTDELPGNPELCPGDDTVTGGDGNDLVVGDGGECTDELFLDVRAAGRAEDCSGDDTVDGGAGDDVVLGDGTVDFECDPGEGSFSEGFRECIPGGDDTVTGGPGDDIVEGGLGDDVVDGGEGNDFVLGDAYLSLVLGDLDDLDPGQLEALLASLREQLEQAKGDPALREELEQALLFLSLLLPGDDDEVSGGPGSDLVAGLGGEDVVCGDLDDVLVLGGTGADVPCATDGAITVDAGTPATGSVAPIRQLDDEDLEVDEEGNPNPYFFVVLVAPTKGTLVLDSTTGAYTYTPFADAEGADSFQIGIRRLVPECQAIDVELLQPPVEVESADIDEICQDVLPTAVVTLGEDRFVQDVATVTVDILKKAVPSVPQGVIDQEQGQQPRSLARTGVETEDLAVGGLLLVALGLVAQAEADRRRRQAAYAAR